MARPRQFDQEAVLNRAMELFWTKGYERTSIQDLVDHTGVHRGSLYDTYGDKNQLFLQCLDRFREVTGGRAFKILEEPGDPKEILQRFFDRIIDIGFNEETGRRGCLIVNTATELGKTDANVSLRVEAFSLDMENMFYKFLVRAQQQGGFKTKQSLRATARFLVSMRNGLYVLGRTATDRKVLEEAAMVAMSIIS